VIRRERVGLFGNPVVELIPENDADLQALHKLHVKRQVDSRQSFRDEASLNVRELVMSERHEGILYSETVLADFDEVSPFQRSGIFKALHNWRQIPGVDSLSDQQPFVVLFRGESQFPNLLLGGIHTEHKVPFEPYDRNQKRRQIHLMGCARTEFTGLSENRLHRKENSFATSSEEAMLFVELPSVLDEAWRQALSQATSSFVLITDLDGNVRASVKKLFE